MVFFLLFFCAVLSCLWYIYSLLHRDLACYERTTCISIALGKTITYTKTYHHYHPKVLPELHHPWLKEGCHPLPMLHCLKTASHTSRSPLIIITLEHFSFHFHTFFWYTFSCLLLSLLSDCVCGLSLLLDSLQKYFHVFIHTGIIIQYQTFFVT